MSLTPATPEHQQVGTSDNMIMIMLGLHINKHFESAPPASTLIHGPKQSLAVTQRQHNWKTGMHDLREVRAGW